jgi:hypothetical protein
LFGAFLVVLPTYCHLHFLGEKACKHFIHSLSRSIKSTH